jgi:hypothetical protein
MWLSTDSKKLEKSFKDIKEGSKSENKGTPSGKVEENSGVEFPGESIEPYVGTSLNFGDKDFNDDELVLVEVGIGKFAY